jgi:membrane protein implicated in regulation of membrane protease activity
MMSDETRDKYYKDSDVVVDDTMAAEGAVTGGAIGGTLGAIIGGIAAIGTNVIIPGLGLVVWGPIAAALAAHWSVGVYQKNVQNCTMKAFAAAELWSALRRVRPKMPNISKTNGGTITVASTCIDKGVQAI